MLVKQPQDFNLYSITIFTDPGVQWSVLYSSWYHMQSPNIFESVYFYSFYVAFIYPCLNHCVEVWGNTYKSCTDPILRLQ